MVNRLFCILVISFFLMGCSKNKETVQNNKIQTKSSTEENQQESSNTTRKEYDFNNYSSQGGIIFAYFTNNKLDKFDIYLLGERGKVIYQYKINEDKTIDIIKNTIEYNQSIYDGDVEIAAQEITEYLIKKNTLYSVVNKQIEKSKEQEVSDFYLEAIKIINTQKQ